MVAIKNLLFLAAAVNAAVIKRTLASLKADLATINSDTTSLDNAIKNYSGGVSGSVPVQQAESKVDKDVQNATKNAQNDGGSYSDADSQSLIDYINNTLEPNIKTTLTDLKAKKAQFAAAGLQSTVHDDLTSLKSDTDAYGAALIKLAPSTKTSAAQAALAKVDADFNDAISYYS